jgi:GT2 family glycosyltransferase
LFLYSEDVDLSWRLAKFGRLVHCSDAVFLHDRRRRGWRSHYWYNRSGLIVLSWHGIKGGPRQALLTGLGNLRRRQLTSGSARLAALASYAVRPASTRRPRSGEPSAAARSYPPR